LFYVRGFITAGLAHNLALTEKGHQTLEAELRSLNAERMDLIEQLNNINRQKNSFLEELESIRREYDRIVILSDRLGGEKEQLVKERGELTIRITANERIITQLNEVSMSW